MASVESPDGEISVSVTQAEIETCSFRRSGHFGCSFRRCGQLECCFGGSGALQSATCTWLSAVATKSSAAPTFPVVQAGRGEPESVPVWEPERSAVVVPAPSAKGQKPTRPSRSGLSVSTEWLAPSVVVPPPLTVQYKCPRSIAIRLMALPLPLTARLEGG